MSKKIPSRIIMEQVEALLEENYNKIQLDFSRKFKVKAPFDPQLLEELIAEGMMFNIPNSPDVPVELRGKVLSASEMQELFTEAKEKFVEANTAQRSMPDNSHFLAEDAEGRELFNQGKSIFAAIAAAELVNLADNFEGSH